MDQRRLRRTVSLSLRFRRDLAMGGMRLRHRKAFPSVDLMDGSDQERALEAPDAQQPANSQDRDEAEGDRASQALRDQIKALRKQVRDAQDSLGDRERGRSLKG